LSPNSAIADEYCLYNIKNANSQLEFPCSYKEYSFIWEGSSILFKGNNVVDGNGYLTLINKNGAQTGKIPATFNKGVLTSNISVGGFRKCLEKDCEEVEYLNVDGTLKFRGIVTFSDENKIHVKSFDYGTLFIGNNCYYHGWLEKNAFNNSGYACLGNTDNKQSIEKLFTQNECPFPSPYFEGYWSQGVFQNGYVRFFSSDGSYYEGDIDDNKIQGWGTYLWVDKSIYEGEFFNNQRNGVGTYKYNNGSIYTGEWKNNVKEGYGELVVVGEDGFVYKGNFSSGVFHGEGIIEFDDGMTYIGKFSDNKPDGDGLIYFDKNNIYKSTFKQGNLIALEPIVKRNSPLALACASTNYVSDTQVAFLDNTWSRVKNSFKRASNWVKENKEHIANAVKGCVVGGAGGALSGGAGGALGGGIVGSVVPGAGTLAGAGVGAMAGAGTGAFSGCINQGFKAWEYSKEHGGSYTADQIYSAFKSEVFSMENFLWGAATGAFVVAAPAIIAALKNTKFIQNIGQIEKALEATSKAKLYGYLGPVINSALKISQKISSKSKNLKDRLFKGAEKSKKPMGPQNKAAGVAREKNIENMLNKKYPPAKGYKVHKEQYLRDKNGQIVKDPQTGEARRVDFVVTKDGKVVKSVEVTSKTAPKESQMLKEERIRKLGGNYIKDQTTGEMIPFDKGVKTEIMRLE
jgi:hypothetical protein